MLTSNQPNFVHILNSRCRCSFPCPRCSQTRCPTLWLWWVWWWIWWVWGYTHANASTNASCTAPTVSTNATCTACGTSTKYGERGRTPRLSTANGQVRCSLSLSLAFFIQNIAAIITSHLFFSGISEVTFFSHYTF